MSGSPFSYAVFRVVPRLDRGERLNVGVVVFCRPLDYLAVRTGFDPERLALLWPDLDLEAVARHLDALERIAAGEADAGQVAALDTTARFHWLVSPSSTTIQPSAVHTGLCCEPADQLGRLYERLVSV